MSMLPIELAQSPDGPVLYARVLDEGTVRATASHRHRRGQLFGALRGVLSVCADQGQWVVPACQAVWIPSRHEHALQSYGPFAGWSVYVAESECETLPPAPCLLRVSGLLREAVLRAAQWPLAPLDPVRQRVAEVILDEIRFLPREPAGLPMPRDPRLQKIAQALLGDLADARPLEEWAAWGGLALRTMSRRFAAETGFSVAQWRQRARLMRALEMLAEGRAVTAIAIDLGYVNVSAFIAMFRKFYGVTPARYFGHATS
jgi:AraC-like DNA-binding protein